VYLYWKWFVFSVFLDIIYTVYTVVEKVCDIKYYVKNILLFYNSVFPIWHFYKRFSSKQFLVRDLKCSQWWGFIMWVELGHHIVWYLHGYECFGAFWVCLQGPSDYGSSRSRPNCLCWHFRLHSSITEKTTISNLNIKHSLCILSLCYK